MKKYFLIIAFALISIIACAQQPYIVSDNTDASGVRLVRTSSVSIPHEIGEFDLFFIGAKDGFFKLYAVVIECKNSQKAWYIDKGSYMIIDIPEKITFAKANKDVKPNVRHDKLLNKTFFEWRAEFEIPFEDGSNLLDNIDSFTFQLRDSDNIKQQIKLDISEEMSKHLATLYLELMTRILL